MADAGQPAANTESEPPKKKKSQKKEATSATSGESKPKVVVAHLDDSVTDAFRVLITNQQEEHKLLMAMGQLVVDRETDKTPTTVEPGPEMKKTLSNLETAVTNLQAAVGTLNTNVEGMQKAVEKTGSGTIAAIEKNAPPPNDKPRPSSLSEKATCLGVIAIAAMILFFVFFRSNEPATTPTNPEQKGTPTSQPAGAVTTVVLPGASRADLYNAERDISSNMSRMSSELDQKAAARTAASENRIMTAMDSAMAATKDEILDVVRSETGTAKDEILVLIKTENEATRTDIGAKVLFKADRTDLEKVGKDLKKFEKKTDAAHAGIKRELRKVAPPPPVKAAVTVPSIITMVRNVLLVSNDGMSDTCIKGLRKQDIVEDGTYTYIWVDGKAQLPWTGKVMYGEPYQLGSVAVRTIAVFECQTEAGAVAQAASMVAPRDVYTGKDGEVRYEEVEGIYPVVRPGKR